MRFDVGSVGVSATRQGSSGGGGGAHGAQRVQLADDDVMSVGTVPASPPLEVRQEMATAAGVYDRLQASGRQITFQVEEGTGKVRIEVHDLAGRVLFTLSSSKALDIAAGGALGGG